MRVFKCVASFILLICSQLSHSAFVSGQGTDRKLAFWAEGVAPLLAAALFQITDEDLRISDRAVKNTPVFGSVSKATQMADLLTLGLYTASVAVDYDRYDSGKISVHELAFRQSLWAVSLVPTGLMKYSFLRTRPNREDRLSFPSGHATRQSSIHQVFTDSLNDYSSTALVIGARVASHMANYSVAWARVESGHHYPSDVLAGMSVGYFVTHWAMAQWPTLKQSGWFSVDELTGRSARLSLAYLW